MGASGGLEGGGGGGGWEVKSRGSGIQVEGVRGSGANSTSSGGGGDERREGPLGGGAASVGASGQGLPLVHFSAHPEPISSLMYTESTQSIQSVAQKVLSSIRRVDECKALPQGVEMGERRWWER